MRIIDVPKYVARKTYEESIMSLANKLSRIDAVECVYQIGSVSHPGISDIDMLVVFKDNQSCTQRVREIYEVDKYLFTHALYGCAVKYWRDLHRFTFFHNYKFLAGKKMPEIESNLMTSEEKELKRQIALEFLVKNYFTLKIQERYRMIKARSLLLEGKALIYDLEFLDVRDGDLWDLVSRIIELRSHWFEYEDNMQRLKEVFQDLPDLIRDLLKEELGKNEMYLRMRDGGRIYRNIYLEKGKKVEVKCKGIIPPSFGILKERRRFNFLHRFNKFEISIPCKEPPLQGVIDGRFNFLSEVKKYNSEFIPDFLIPASSLNIN